MKSSKIIAFIFLISFSHILSQENKSNLRSLWFVPSMSIPWYAEVQILRTCLNDKCKQRTDGFQTEYSGEGRIDLDFYHLHTYGAMSVRMDMKYNPGTLLEYSKNIHFIGWNFLLTQSVSRYLIIDNKCTTYYESYGIPGDPIKTVLDKFTQSSDIYDFGDKDFTFTETLKNGDLLSATVTTTSQYSPLKEIVVEVISNGAKSRTITTYTNGRSRSTFDGTPEDSDLLLNRFKTLKCEEVPTMKPLDVCIEGTLGLEYECN